MRRSAVPLIVVAIGVANAHAEGIGIVGPSAHESFLLIGLPITATVFAAIAMLFSWRTFVALAGACCLGLMWVLLGVATLTSIVGAFMLMFSAWALFVFVVGALVLAVLPASPGRSKSPPRAEPVQVAVVRGPPFGRCPNCSSVLALRALECPECHALFAEGVAWKVTLL